MFFEGVLDFVIDDLAEFTCRGRSGFFEGPVLLVLCAFPDPLFEDGDFFIIEFEVMSGWCTGSQSRIGSSTCSMP